MKGKVCFNEPQLTQVKTIFASPGKMKFHILAVFRVLLRLILILPAEIGNDPQLKLLVALVLSGVEIPDVLTAKICAQGNISKPCFMDHVIVKRSGIGCIS